MISIRKVKCDEQSPACQKCISTGRRCEWFGVFRDGYIEAKPEARSKTLSPPSRPQSSLAAFPNVKALELRGFEFFQMRTAQEMCPVFDFGFWSLLVLQLSQSEPAILHAVIALGTLHETEECLGMPISKDRLKYNDKHIFAVSQYNISIKLLTEQAKAGGNPAHARRIKASVLTTCLIFTHIDLLRGLYEPAVVHIRSALKILEESSDILSPDVDRIMRTAFRRLDLQSSHFDQAAPFSELPLDDLSTVELNLAQPSIGIPERKSQYDTLLYPTFQLLRTCERNVLQRQQDHLENEYIKHKRRILLRLHTSFLQQCISLRQEGSICHSYRDQQALLLLEMHASLMLIFLSVCMAPNIEDAFDDYLSEFQYILSLAKIFISRQTGQNGKVSKLSGLSTDWGIIFPLSFTALKCRDYNTRISAITLLDSWKHREGFWDSALAAACCRELMQLERAGDTTEGALVQPMANIQISIPVHQLDVTMTWEWGDVTTRVPATVHSHTMAI